MRTLALIVAAGFAVVALGCQGDISKKPPVHLNWNMDQVSRFDPQEPNPFFENGMAQRPLIAGTVARGQLRDDDHLYRGKDAKGEYVATLPEADNHGVAITADKAFLERGKQRYNIYCGPCHETSGEGRGVVIQRALDAAKGKEGGPGFNPPPSFHDERLVKAPVGTFFHVMTDGWGNMMSYKSQIVVRDRWAISAYVRAMQVAKVEGIDFLDVPASKVGGR